MYVEIDDSYGKTIAFIGADQPSAGATVTEDFRCVIGRLSFWDLDGDGYQW